MNKSHLRKVAAIALALGLGVTACSSGAGAGAGNNGTSGSAKQGGNLVMARPDDSVALLPPETSANADIWILQQIYQTLTVNNQEGTGVDPLLATSWKTSGDGLTWTFAIREGVTFQSGQKMTAKDVAWSLNFDRTASDTNQWSSLFEAIKSIEATNDNTVAIHLSAKWPALPAYLALFAAAIYPADFGGHAVDYIRTHPDGTGPFKFKEWVKGQSLSIVKNKNYWEKGLPYLDSVKFNLVADDNTRSLQLQGGQADIDEFPSPTSMASLSKTSGIVAKAIDSTKIFFININTRAPGLNDPAVRRAMAYAVDRKAILKTVLSGYGEAANSFLASALPGHDKSVDGAVYDMAKAKAEMAKSKTPDGLPITIEIAAGFSDRQQIAQILQQSWAEIGIKVKIKVVDGTVASADRRAAKFDVQIAYATSDVIDPLEMVAFLVLTKDGAGINSGYDNPQVYAWAKQIASETDTAQQNALLAKMQQTVSDDSPLIPIAFQPDLYAYSNKVHGFSSDVLGTYTLKTTWKDN